MYIYSILMAKMYSKDMSVLKCVSLSCMFHQFLKLSQHSQCVCMFPVYLCRMWVYVCMFSPHQPLTLRGMTLWSRTWIAHWFLGASLTIHSDWFLALLGVRVMAVLMYHLYVYSSPTATGFTIVWGKCIYNTMCKWGLYLFVFLFYYIF